MSMRFMAIDIPVNADGKGPEMDETKVTDVLYEVWDMEDGDRTIATAINMHYAGMIASALNNLLSPA